MFVRSAFALGALVIACGDREAPPAPAPVKVPGVEAEPHERELAALLAFEERRRGETDFTAAPPSDAVLGADPYRIAALGTGYVGLLRGESQLVVVDGDGVEQARIDAPRSPTGLAVAGDGSVVVVGEGTRTLARYRHAAGKLARVAEQDVALDMRDVALSPDGKTTYVVEEREGRLLALTGKTVRELGRCHGPVDVEVIAGHVVTNCVLDHAIEIRRDAEVTRIRHDGPIWSFALHREADGGVLVAAGGIEDHPLVREDGGFGYIDSYVFVYRLAPGATKPVRLAAINASELGAITPKWIALRVEGQAVSVTTAGYASANLVTLVWRDGDFAAKPDVTHAEIPPGTAAAHLTNAAFVAANPLLDAWVVRRADKSRIVPIASTQVRALKSRIGELLFFTSAMAPWNGTDGKLSRFTCEACHHEGYVDGRTHFTGRESGGDKVIATSRPLLGLFNNRPHFSRALDKTMTDMVHAEFRVANRHNGRDPWFALTHADLPWLAMFGAPARMTPEYLREAFMTFLMDFSHRPNPAAQGRAAFSDLERTGAATFRDRCASCHAPRSIADTAATAVPFERWERLVLSPNGPIVWSDATYHKTGVTPYVIEDGARVPPLRRLYKKWPYFTTGIGTSLGDVLDRYGVEGKRTYHDGAPASAARLSPDDKAALLAFLQLL